MNVLNFFHCTKFFHPLRCTASAGVDRTVGEGVEDGVLIIHDFVVDGLQIYAVFIPVRIILNQNHFSVVHPGFYFKRTAVNHVGSFCAVAFAVLLHDVLTLWLHDSAIGQRKEVWSWLLEGKFNSLVVDCFYTQLRWVHLACQNCVCVFNTGQQVGVWRTGFRGQGSYDGVNIVLCFNRLTVAPGVFAQMEGPYGTIFIGFPGFSACALTDVFAIFFSQSGQWLHYIVQNAATDIVVTDNTVQGCWVCTQVAVEVLLCIQHVAVDGLLLCAWLSSAFLFALAAASSHRKHHRTCQHDCQDSFDFHDCFSFRA